MAHCQPKTAAVFCGCSWAEPSEATFGVKERALTLVKQLGVAQKWCKQLTQLLAQGQDWKEEQLDEWLDEPLPKLGMHRRKRMKDGLAIAAYRTQPVYAVVELFVCDDAPQCTWVTVQLALCWMHEYRHYQQLIP